VWAGVAAAAGSSRKLSPNGLPADTLNPVTGHTHYQGPADKLGVYMLPCTCLGAMVPLVMITNAASRLCREREGFICVWRRGRDSNPRDGRPPSGFQDRRLKPLGHPSSAAPACARRCAEVSASRARFQLQLRARRPFLFREVDNSALFSLALKKAPRSVPDSAALCDPRRFSSHTAVPPSFRDDVRQHADLQLSFAEEEGILYMR
jgi:hypothetical protein